MNYLTSILSLQSQSQHQTTTTTMPANSPSSTFPTASIPELISKLTKEEKILLLGSPDWWHTYPIPRLGIPSAKMSDGPNGVRGASFFLQSPAQCLPCSTALGATFDPELISETGAFLADEAKLKSAAILLAPTCNIQRSPLGGRSFESFSEDPFLSGACATAYINGLQSKGVAATIKHFVVNDQEHERMGSSSNLSERALREIYLYPFMLAQRDAKPMAYMTAYNRLNGVHCSENYRLLTTILRREWGFDGLIMSDWFGTYSVTENVNAGLSLEMPGPPRWRTPELINHSFTSQKLTIATVNKRVEEVLKFVQNLSRISPDTIFGDDVERSRETTPAIRSFTRKLASNGIVLLKNENKALPILPPAKGKPKTKVAVIGPNAKARSISGGGSANLKPSYVVKPFDGIMEHVTGPGRGAFEVEYHVGCYSHKYLPQLIEEMSLPDDPDKKGLWRCTFFNHDPATDTPLSTPLAEYDLNDARVLLNDFLPPGITPNWSMRVSGWFTPQDYTGLFEFGITVAGRAKLYVDDKLVVDNWTVQRPGTYFDGRGAEEETGTCEVKAGQPVKIRVEYTNTPPPDSEESDEPQASPTYGVRFGGAPVMNPQQAIQDAAELAARSDVAVLIVGLSNEWESEGSDRKTLAFPGKQDELIEAVARVCKRVVVVVQAGSATAMPWHPSVSAILQTWYLGNEAGTAIADVLFGTVNPSGKLPLSFPHRLQDVPSYLNYGSENGQVYYREDLFVGYKWYHARSANGNGTGEGGALFPFGFGLSYTTFEYGSLSISRLADKKGGSSSSSSSPSSIKWGVSFTIKNTGDVIGSEAAQIYVSLPQFHPTTGARQIPTTPEWQLRQFVKAKDLKPGETRRVSVSLDKYAVSFWDVMLGEEEEGGKTGKMGKTGAWRVCEGVYKVAVGSSSAAFHLRGALEVRGGEGFVWEGL